MPVVDEIRARLAQFQPDRLEVIDESARHAGHAGARPEGESHFRVRIAAAAFAPMSRLARHRAIHAALGPELLARIHALALEIED
ncbi:BolA family protein [Phaeovulum sp. NW3]|uniref:BolA family protein n=1 Tax=Phaeovulum sp. NW3 TaxID=2934933 RepID=UPI0020225B3C|nr:BolA family protein [Phaeovulum sp. NW3]MCL7464416.1 BolA family transcriptional regulator [Phaeovulum sp. NW3]